MPGTLVQLGASILCPHGGQVQITPTAPRVTSNGQPLATVGDVYLVSGCVPPGPPGQPPCANVKWMVGALRVKIGGQPALLNTSVGMAMGGIPGPPIVGATQLRVKGM